MANERTQYPLIGSSFHPWPGQVESRLFGFFAPAKKFASPDYTRALSPSLPPSLLGLHTRHRRRGLMLRRRNGFKNAAGRILALFGDGDGGGGGGVRFANEGRVLFAAACAPAINLF